MSEEGNFFNLKSGTEPALSVLLGTKKKKKEKKRKSKARINRTIWGGFNLKFLWFPSLTPSFPDYAKKQLCRCTDTNEQARIENFQFHYFFFVLGGMFH
jgi:hypothetical protein